ncbi:MAG: GTP 3',8-cyclase MoaA [Sulfolobales archaeon]
MIDRYGRQLLNARLVITLKCNFRCIFCHRENAQKSFDSGLSADELTILFEAFARVGMKKYKITGGEPLMREDITEIIEGLKNYGESEDISMTTNGFFLKERVGDLVEVGLNRINVSLHTLKPNRFELITGVNGVDEVTSGIKESLNYNLNKIKINFVALKGINDDEIWDIIRFAENLGIHVQLIELHPVGRGRNVFTDYHTSLSGILNELREKASKIMIRGELHNRPIYVLDTGTTVEVVRPVLNPIFCAGCSRIRVLPDGTLMPCLNNDIRLPTIHIIRGEGSRDQKISKIVNLIQDVNDKRKPHTLWPIKSDIDQEYLNIIKLGGFARRFKLN